MSGFDNGNIILDEERDIYYAGQVLYGKIDFGLSQPLVFRAINVEFHGEGSVDWSETEVEESNGYRTETNQDYTAYEEYFNVVQCICGGVGVSQLPPGSHSIPFSFQIPATAPSYFEGSDGRVTYYVKASLESTDDTTVELEKAFEVVVPIDMNLNPAMKEPIYMEFEEVLSSCLCGSGPLTVQIKLPATGFCPGQIIPVEINADNQSSVEVSSIKFELVRRGCYRSKEPRSDKIPPPERLQMCRQGAILARTKRSITCDFEVPEMIAPGLDNCGIIDVEFYFKVLIKLAGCNDDLEDETEIFLGLVPIAELVDGLYKHPMQHALPNGPIPNLNAPPQFIQPSIYPSVTLENKVQPVHVQNVSHYPGANAYPAAGYPGNNYPPGNSPYPGHAPYPANGPSNAPYPGANTGYPGTSPPYAGANPPYPGANPPYTGSNPPYPGANPPFPGANPPFPGANPPYPGGNPPYPGANPPYPSANAENPPYPMNPQQFAPSPAGFRAPESSPGYPMGPVTTSPYNPSAPPAP